MELRNIAIKELLAVADGQGVRLITSLRKRERDFEFCIESQLAEAAPREHCRGLLVASPNTTAAPPKKTLQELIKSCVEMPIPQALFDGADGLRLGPHWRCLRRMWRGDGEGVAELELSSEFAAELATFPLHPALLDGAFGFVGLWLPAPYVPCGYGSVRLFAPLSRQLVSQIYYALPDGAAPDTLELDVTVRDLSGSPLVEVSRLALRRLHVRTR